MTHENYWRFSSFHGFNDSKTKTTYIVSRKTPMGTSLIIVIATEKSLGDRVRKTFISTNPVKLHELD